MVFDVVKMSRRDGSKSRSLVHIRHGRISDAARVIEPRLALIRKMHEKLRTGCVKLNALPFYPEFIVQYSMD